MSQSCQEKLWLALARNGKLQLGSRPKNGLIQPRGSGQAKPTDLIPLHGDGRSRRRRGRAQSRLTRSRLLGLLKPERSEAAHLDDETCMILDTLLDTVLQQRTKFWLAGQKNFSITQKNFPFVRSFEEKKLKVQPRCLFWSAVKESGLSPSLKFASNYATWTLKYWHKFNQLHL